MATTVILGSARTPIGKLGGALASLPAASLGAIAVAGALERSGVAGDQVEHVVLGTVLAAGQGQVPSRQAAHAAGIPVTVSSETLNKACASGMRAVSLLDLAIRAGDLDVGVGGGMESMSRAPYLLDGARFGLRMGDATVNDSMLRDGLLSAYSGKHMAEEATEVAAELEITRADMDRWALRSHQRAIAAIDEGRMAEEIVAATVSSRGGETVVD
ncbi:MAG: acetyl-CoA C-acyltransferase, partial [Solirubrobacteraceae bacterium]